MNSISVARSMSARETTISQKNLRMPMMKFLIGCQMPPCRLGPRVNGPGLAGTFGPEGTFPSGGVTGAAGAAGVSAGGVCGLTGSACG